MLLEEAGGEGISECCHGISVQHMAAYLGRRPPQPGEGGPPCSAGLRLALRRDGLGQAERESSVCAGEGALQGSGTTRGGVRVAIRGA